MRLHRNQTATGLQIMSWCGPLAYAPREGASRHPIRAEAPGYFAMVAFLFAYLLSVSGVGRPIQPILNLAGAAAGAVYLHKKGALPSVISNLAWMAITLAGLIVH